jgi:glycosyltransferase involved in cell wall biosynthesis
MQTYYGPEGYRAAEQSLMSGSVEGLTQRYPLTALALENSLGVLVHTRESYDELTGTSRQLVAYAPLPFSSASVTEATRKTRRDDHPYRVVLFGFINRNRQLQELLESLARFPQKNKFVLDIYGDVWDAGHVRNQIKKLGLSRLVTLRGFASHDVLDAALDGAALAINLRYPTMGEASISQLRIWAHSLPSLVTSLGWYGDLPDTVVAHVRPGHELEDIHAHLNAFLTDYARFKRMGQEGRRLLEEQHKPETYVATLLELAEQALLFRPRAVAYNLADRVGTQMSAWADALSSDQALKKAAEEILALTEGSAA